MRKLDPPAVDFATALSESISGIGSAGDRAVYVAAFPNPGEIEANYKESARAGSLYAQPRILENTDPPIQGPLLKSQLVKLYTQYFVPADKPARRIYDDIKITSNGKCPLCGGVGHVRTLDHYLPKANFPLYSVMPTNLVPCCRDCNSEKLNAFATTRESQTIHPYFDHDRFFEEQWIRARIVQTLPPVIEYFVAPPAEWNIADISRVRAHFNEYDLGRKFSVEAAADLPETIHTRRTTMAQNSSAEFSQYLAEKGHSPGLPINNWRRVMFAAMASDAWFCAQGFAEVVL